MKKIEKYQQTYRIYKSNVLECFYFNLFRENYGKITSNEFAKKIITLYNLLTLLFSGARYECNYYFLTLIKQRGADIQNSEHIIMSCYRNKKDI